MVLVEAIVVAAVDWVVRAVAAKVATETARYFFMAISLSEK
jgi:hypothetical protein